MSPRQARQRPALLTVRMTDEEYVAAKAVAAKLGISLSVMTRRALADAVGRATGGVQGTVTAVWVVPVAGEGGSSVGSAAAQVASSPSRPEPVRERTPGLAKALSKMTPAEIRKAAIGKPVEQHQLHEHVAGKATSSGLHPCTAKGCTAMKVAGRWVEP